MFKRILLPLDLTAKHQQAVEVAAELARQSGGEVTLLHVVQEIQGVAKDEEREFFQRLEQTAKASLERTGALLAERGIACRSLVRYGDRAQEVVDCAAEFGIDLIVVTAPRVDTEQRALSWASLSWKIGVQSRCPVLLVK